MVLKKFLCIFTEEFLIQKNYSSMKLYLHYVICQILLLWESYLHIRNDLIHASFVSQLGAVQTQIIVPCICPFPSGMILIVLRTVLIRLIDKALQFLRAHAMLLRCTFQTIFLRGMNKMCIRDRFLTLCLSYSIHSSVLS